MKQKLLLPIIIAPLVILIDQLTKLYIDLTLPMYASYTVVEHFFQITYLRNKGAAFGILATSPYRLPFFIGISLVAVVAIGYYIHRLRPDQRLAAIALSLVLAGALGNLIDRIRLGEVIDFLYFHWYTHYWPAFNVADSAICVGVGLLVVDMLREERRAK